MVEILKRGRIIKVFVIGAYGVSLACRRVAQKIEIDEKLKRKINKIEKKIDAHVKSPFYMD